MNYQYIGKKIKKLREIRQMTQKELANLLNLSESYISYLENGARPIGANDLHKIAKIFDVNYSYFFERDVLQSHFRSNHQSTDDNSDSIDKTATIDKFREYIKEQGFDK